MTNQKIFGIGLSKTGTTSLTQALQILGYQALHYPRDDRTLEQLLHADFRLDLFERFDALTDTTIVPYYKCFDRLLLNGVLVRDVTRALLIGRAFRLWGTMIESGVPMVEGLRLTRVSIRNSLFRDLFDTLENEVVNGRPLGNAFLESPFVPPAAVGAFVVMSVMLPVFDFATAVR